MRTKMKICMCALAFAVLLAGCTGYETASSNGKAAPNTNAVNTVNSNPAPAAAAPSKEALAALEKQAFEAWSKKDSKFFDGFLAANFIGFGDNGQRMGRADVVKMMGESKCEVKSYTFSDERMTPVGQDAAVITMKVDADYTCDGKKGPTPVTSASVYVREGNAWKGAYHNEIPITDPKNMKADTKKPPAPPAPAGTTPADPMTDALMAAEKRGWEAWKARDAKTLDEITTKDLTLVDMFGRVTTNKADIIKGWTEPPCTINSVAVSDGKAVSLTKDAAILTFKGTADGKCNDMPITPLWGTTVSVKDGDAWKAVYILEAPA